MVSIRNLGAILMLAALASALQSDAGRAQSISTKMFCTCGCREVLAECGHPQCPRKDVLKQQIADGLTHNLSDDEILDQMAVRYGAATLIVPEFRGFNLLLWIVPLAAVVSLVIGILIWRRRMMSSNHP